MAKIIVNNIATGTLTLNGIGSQTICTVDTTDVKGHNLDNCAILIEGSVIAASSVGRVAFYRGRQMFKKIAGTINKPASLSGLDIVLEEVLMVGAVTFTFDIAGNLINLNVSNNSPQSLTVESSINLFVGCYNPLYTDKLFTFA